MSSVPLHILEREKNELREDDARREQSLAQFREWISKHPFINDVKTGKKIIFNRWKLKFNSFSKIYYY